MTDRERRLRDHLWNDPGIVERLFSDSSWESYSEDLSQTDIPSERISAKLQEAIAADALQSRRTLRRMRQRQEIARWAIAAALLLFSGVFSWQVWTSQSADVTTDRYAANAIEQLSDTSTTSLFNTAKKPKQYTLPDGSKVRLYAQAKLTYPSAFSPSSRELQLEGKAYFDVAKDAARPFTVYAGATKTTALGTSFTINIDEKKQRTSVTLHSGKVAVAPILQRTSLKRTILSTQGESILFDAAFQVVAHHTPTIQKRPNDTQKHVENAVSKGVLEIDNIPLEKVIAQLEHAYGATIRFGEPSLQQIRYTGTVDLEKEKLRDVLTIICLINDLRYVVQEDGSYLLMRQADLDNAATINQHDTTEK